MARRILRREASSPFCCSCVPAAYSVAVHIRSATVADAPRLIELWAAAGLKFRPEDVPADLAAVLARDPDLVLVAEDAAGLTTAVLGTFDGRRGWVNRLATRTSTMIT